MDFTALKHMVFNVFQALKGLEQRSNHLIDLVANSTGHTIDVMYATLVHRCEAWHSLCISPSWGSNLGFIQHQLAEMEQLTDYAKDAQISAGWV